MKKHFKRNFRLSRKCTILLNQNLVDLCFLTEKDDLVDWNIWIKVIGRDVLDNSREALIFSQLLEVNGIIGCEIPIFWFYTYADKNIQKEFYFSSTKVISFFENSPKSFAFMASFGILRN